MINIDTELSDMLSSVNFDFNYILYFCIKINNYNTEYILV